MIRAILTFVGIILLMLAPHVSLILLVPGIAIIVIQCFTLTWEFKNVSKIRSVTVLQERTVTKNEASDDGQTAETTVEEVTFEVVYRSGRVSHETVVKGSDAYDGWMYYVH